MTAPGRTQAGIAPPLGSPNGGCRWTGELADDRPDRSLLHLRQVRRAEELVGQLSEDDGRVSLRLEVEDAPTFGPRLLQFHSASESSQDGYRQLGERLVDPLGDVRVLVEV